MDTKDLITNIAFLVGGLILLLIACDKRDLFLAFMGLVFILLGIWMAILNIIGYILESLKVYENRGGRR